MSNSISSVSSTPSWETIKETALKNQNLNADIRVSADDVEVNVPSTWQRFKVTIGWEKAPVYASREETLKNLRQQFRLDFSQKLQMLIYETGVKTDSAEYNTLMTTATQSFTAITQELTTAIDTTVSTSQVIQQAHEDALNSLALLREQFARPQLTPQFCKTKEGQWSVLQPAPHPENFVLSGGGVKGAGYVGWFKAAERFGVLKNLKRIAGSSAGAMTAALIASGMSADDFQKATDRINFWSVLTGTSSDPAINAATQLETKGWLSYFSFRGTYAVDHLNQEMVGSIKKYFGTFNSEEAFKKAVETILNSKVQSEEIKASEKEQLMQSVTTLYQNMAPPPPHWLFGSWLQRKKSTYMVTFGDLAALAKVDSRFKELTVTGYTADKHQERYFNAERTPRLAIATAVRGSIALPGFFNEVIINGEQIEDGGVGSNTPAEVFRGLPQEKTFVLQFENNGAFDHTVYSISDKKKSAGLVGTLNEGVNYVEEKGAEVLTGNPDFGTRIQWDDQKLYSAGPNAMMVADGDLEVTSFSATQERIRQAQRQAEIRATEAFSLRQDQAIESNQMTFQEAVSFVLKDHAIDYIFESLKNAMKIMTAAELENIAVHYASTSDSKEFLSKSDRLSISKAAQDELATRTQPELPLQV